MNKIESFFVTKVGVSFFKVFVLLITLFFLWGFALGLLDVLNKHFQSIIESSTSKYALVLMAFYAGYLLMPIPASLFNERFGYKSGILSGLSLYAFGAFLFIPIAYYQSFPLFLFALFCIALGMATLETNVNLYTVVVGEKKYSTFRLTLAQAFTSIGWFYGPLVGSSILSDIHNQNRNEFSIIEVPYVGIGVLVVFLAILILITNFPKITSEEYKKPKAIPKLMEQGRESIFKHRHFTGAVIAMAFYVLAQTALFGFYAQYLFDLFKGMEHQTVIGQEYLLKLIRLIGGTDTLSDQLYHTVAGFVFSFVGFGLFALGRFVGSFMLIDLSPSRLLTISSLVSIFLTIIMALDLGLISFIALCLITLSMSIMFPVIYSLGIRKMGYLTTRASACIVMAITGGSFYYLLLNSMPTISTISIGIVLLLISFLVVLFYGLSGFKVRGNVNI